MSNDKAVSTPIAPAPATRAGHGPGRKWGQAEWLFLLWVVPALLLLFPISAFLQGAFPVFTALWLIVPFGTVLWTRDARRVGFQRISWRAYRNVTALSLGAQLLIALAIEPWSHTYQALLRGALASEPLDTTFGW
jgi:hypothetical protein